MSATSHMARKNRIIALTRLHSKVQIRRGRLSDAHLHAIRTVVYAGL